MPRALTLSTSILDGSRLPVAGEVSLVLSHSSMAERSYVWPSMVNTGSRMSSCVMGQRSEDAIPSSTSAASAEVVAVAGAADELAAKGSAPKGVGFGGGTPSGGEGGAERGSSTSSVGGCGSGRTSAACAGGGGGEGGEGGGVGLKLSSSSSTPISPSQPSSYASCSLPSRRWCCIHATRRAASSSTVSPLLVRPLMRDPSTISLPRRESSSCSGMTGCAPTPRSTGLSPAPLEAAASDWRFTKIEFLSGRVCLAGAVTLASALPRRPGMEKPSKMDARGRAAPPSTVLSLWDWTRGEARASISSAASTPASRSAALRAACCARAASSCWVAAAASPPPRAAFPRSFA